VAYKLKKFDAVAPSVLEPGESFVAGAFALLPGGVKRQMGLSAFGAIGAATSGLGHGTAGSFTLPRKFVLGLTNRRIAIFAIAYWSGRPNKLLGSLPLSSVEGAHWDGSGTMSRRATISLIDGGRLDFEATKGAMRAATESFLDALRAQLQTHTLDNTRDTPERP
jgi:hypothetical protein